MDKQYKFSEYMLHDIAEQLRVSSNHVIKEPCPIPSLKN